MIQKPPQENKPQVRDQEGWSFGISAALKGLFGTDTEVRIRHGGMEEEVQHAKQEIGRMSKESENLLQHLNGGGNEHPSKMEQAFEDLVRDL